MLQPVVDGKTLCGSCGRIVSIKWGKYKNQDFYCHDCLQTFVEVPKDEIEEAIKILKNSKKQFVQDLIKYYKENNRLSVNQFSALCNCMTKKQSIKYYIATKDIEQLILWIDNLNDTQILQLINMIKKYDYQLSKRERRTLKNNIENDKLLNMINEL